MADANLGTVSVALQADLSQYSRPMQQATLQMQQVASVASTKVAPAMDQVASGMSKAGRQALDNVAYGMSIAGREAATLAPKVDKVTESVLKSIPGHGRLTNVLGNVAFEMVGLSGAAGKVAETLTHMAVGGGVTLALVGGLAAIGYAFDKLTEDARKNQKELDDILSRIEDRWKRTSTGMISAEIQQAQTTREGLVERIRARNAAIGFSPVVRLEEALSPQLPKMENELAKLDTYLAQLRGDLVGAHKDVREKFAPSLEKATKATSELNAENREAIRVMTELGKAYQATQLKALQQENLATVMAQVAKAPIQPGDLIHPNIPAPDLSIPFDADAMAAELGQKLEAVIHKGPVKEAGNDLGEFVGMQMSRGIARSLVEGAKNIGDVLKNVFLSALEEVLAAIIKSEILDKIVAEIQKALKGGGGGGDLAIVGAAAGFALGGPVGGAIGGFLGGMFEVKADSMVSPRMANVTVPISAIPPMPTPQMMARDAQWIALYSETARVAEQYGVKLRLA